MQKIIIIGGGAGGLELATDPGGKISQKDKTQNNLIENGRAAWRERK